MANLAYIVTSPQSADKLLVGQLAYMQAQGHRVAVLCSPGAAIERVTAREGVPVYPLPMARDISPARDLVSLARMLRTLRQLRPDIVIAGTPKAGLLGIVAAWLLRVPHRIYLLHGLRSETLHGVRRVLVNGTERLASACANLVVAVGPSLRARYLQLGLAQADKVVVLGEGTCNGVDVAHFAPDTDTRAAAAQLRARLLLSEGEPVIGFVGRIVRDKGIAELYAAFTIVAETLPRARLLMVGRPEPVDPVAPELAQALAHDPRVIMCGEVEDTAAYYQLMDVCAFPTFREGFPSVPLEAALAGVPTVAFRATGVVDAVVDNVTGVLVDSGDTTALATQLLRLLQAPETRAKLAAAGAARVRASFDNHRVWRNWLTLFQGLLDHERKTAA